jgi:hypothetical protein
MSDFLDGGTSLPSVTFAEIGDKVRGQIITQDERDDTKPDGTLNTWPDGRAKKVFIFGLDTDGDGQADQTLWVRGNLVKALRDAMKAAGCTSALGTHIEVTHHALGDKRPGFAQAKLFTAKAKPGTLPQASTFVADEEPW